MMRQKKITVVGNHKYQETGSVNYVESSLKSHHLWVTLYYKLCIMLLYKKVIICATQKG